MIYHFTTTIARVFFDANRELIDDEVEVGPDVVDENDQRTMRQYFMDKVNDCLAADNLVETNTVAALFYDGGIDFRNIQGLATTIGSFLRSNRPSTVRDDVGKYFFVVSVVAQVK